MEEVYGGGAMAVLYSPASLSRVAGWYQSLIHPWMDQQSITHTFNHTLTTINSDLHIIKELCF